MNSSQTTSTADLGDRHRRFMAFAMLSIALMYSLSATRRFAGTLARAHAVSWRSTFLLILVLAPFTDNLSTLSPKVFLELVLAEMLGVFALVFLYLNRATPEDELEDSPSA